MFYNLPLSKRHAINEWVQNTLCFDLHFPVTVASFLLRTVVCGSTKYFWFLLCTDYNINWKIGSVFCHEYSILIGSHSILSYLKYYIFYSESGVYCFSKYPMESGNRPISLYGTIQFERSNDYLYMGKVLRRTKKSYNRTNRGVGRLSALASLAGVITCDASIR